VNVDIVVPVYGAEGFLKACIRCVKEYTEWPYTLWISDDNSPQEGLKAYIRHLGMDPHGRIRVVQSSITRGFPANCNLAAARGVSPLLCLLNSDTEPMPGWLTAMATRILSSPDIAVVGARLLFSFTREPKEAGRIQHAGVAFNGEGAPYHPFRGYPPMAPEVMEPRFINAVTGACMLVRRSVWEELGGFDERFVGGQYEDIDFCLRARHAGYRIAYEPQAVLYHHEHGSGDEFVYAASERNRPLLLQKWPEVACDESLFGIPEGGPVD